MSKNLIALQNKFLGHGTTVYDELAKLSEQKGHLADEDLLALAQRLNLPPAHVRATAKFYEELSCDTAARQEVKICNGEACAAAGYPQLEKRLEAGLKTAVGTISPSGVRLAHVACLGYCGRGPNVLVNGTPISLASESRVNEVLKSVEGDGAHGFSEPQNELYPPPSGSPSILMRHFDRGARSLAAAGEQGIYGALKKAVTSMKPQEVIDALIASELRGRGGAGFPAGRKLQTVADSVAPDGSGRKFVVVNFDEGDAGSYIDKELVEQDPHTLLEGILLTAFACGAQEAIIYARYEYPRARKILQGAIDEARAAGLIDAPLFGTDVRCEIRMVKGQGAYICGEETSLLRSLEGLPALVSIRPPFPAQEGLWRCPTALNNVETVHNLSWIIENGGESYRALGHKRSRGTKAISLNSRVKNPGMYEVEFGITLREILDDVAGGMAPGQVFKAIQVGGPLGALLPESLLDTPLDFEAMAAVGAIVGHAGIVVYSEEDDLVKIARGLMAFCAVESCGKCFPCRIGSVRGTELFDQIIDRGPTPERMQLLTELCETMTYGSLCAMGGMTPAPIESIIKHFPAEFDRYRRSDAPSGGQ